jgi:hypothetical protein
MGHFNLASCLPSHNCWYGIVLYCTVLRFLEHEQGAGGDPPLLGAILVDIDLAAYLHEK